jgi:hypothetical protein
MSVITKRLSRTKPYSSNEKQKTFQDSLTNEQIKEYLKDYKSVDDIYKVAISTHIRYFTIDQKTNNKLFRLGGTLNKFGQNGEYIILSNGELSWSVQIKNTIFYKKMTELELREEIKHEILTEVQENVINELDDKKVEYKNLEKEYKNLEKKHNILDKKNKKLEEYIYTKDKEFKNLMKKNDLLNEQLEDIKKEILKMKNKK